MAPEERPISEKEGVMIITPISQEICADPRGGLEEIRTAMNEAAGKQPKALVVNLSNVEYVDSIGLGAIVSGKMKLPDDCDFRVCNLRSKIDTFFRISGLNKFVQLDDDLDSAISSVKRGDGGGSAPSGGS